MIPKKKSKNLDHILLLTFKFVDPFFKYQKGVPVIVLLRIPSNMIT